MHTHTTEHRTANAHWIMQSCLSSSDGIGGCACQGKIWTHHIQMHVSTNIHCVQTDPLTRQPRKRDIKLQQPNTVSYLASVCALGTFMDNWLGSRLEAHIDQ